MKMKEYREEIEIPEGVSVTLENDRKIFVVSKGKFTLKRMFFDPRICIEILGNVIVLRVPLFTRSEKMQIGTFRAHIKNMFIGVNNPFVYKLKVCSGHFPMNIAVIGKQFTVKNFIGEKVPRVLDIKEGVEVKVEGADITVTSSDKELAGQTASAMELLCRRPGFDPRIFQQGIFITEKAGKAVH